jgi:hypothetical protein
LGYKRRYISIPMSVKENELRSDLRLRKTISDRVINKFGKDYLFLRKVKIS